MSAIEIPSETPFLTLINQSVRLSQMPAVKILEAQIAKIARNMQFERPKDPKKYPTAEAIAFEITKRLLKTSFYQRIAEQPMFGPADVERSEDLEFIRKNFQQIKLRFASDVASYQIKPEIEKLYYEDGWLHLGRKAGKPKEQRKTAYRIYLSPKPEKAGEIFAALARKIPETVPFKMKTFDRPSDPLDFARLDKIIIYPTEESAQIIWEALTEIHAAHADAFAGRMAPGGGKPTQLEGVSVLRQPQETGGMEKTGTMKVADDIEDQLKKTVIPLSTKKLLAAKNKSSLSRTNIFNEPEWKLFTMNIDQAIFKDPKRLYFDLTEKSQHDLRIIFRDAILRQSLKAAESGQFSWSRVNQDFFSVLAANYRKIGISETAYWAIQSKKDISHIFMHDLQSLIGDAIYRTGIGITFIEAVSQNRSVSKSFGRLMDTSYS